MTVAFATLGCRLNQFETDSLATRFAEAGYRVVDFDQPADIRVINSCTVTNRADRKSRNLLYRAWRAASEPGDPADTPLTVLTGCFVDSHRDRIESDGRTLVVPNQAKQSIFDLVEARLRGEIVAASGSVFDFPVPSRLLHTRTTLKIQDGCDNHCTFCIIPFVRGRAVSRPAPEVLDSSREAIDRGARELVLTGVNMSRYRDDNTRFSGLVEAIIELPGDFRLRISSLEPDGLDDRFIDLFARPKMVPHLHLCLQSGSERTLLAMRRQYTYTLYRSLADRLRSIDPLFNLTTDVIVGFPGESEDDFAATLEAIAEVGFGHVHTFTYSVRSGTRAERMPGHVSESVKSSRSRLVREAAEREKRRYRERLVGTTDRVLVERTTHRGGTVTIEGLGSRYVPVRVLLDRGERDGGWQNTFIDVEMNRLGPGPDPVLCGRLR